MTLQEFVDRHCPGKSYDSCHDSPCPYSSHLHGCTHPLHPKNQSGWAVTIEALTAIDAGFTGTEDEDSLIVWHDHEWIGRYSRNASLVCLIADARAHMKAHHDLALPYSMPAVAGGA